MKKYLKLLVASSTFVQIKEGDSRLFKLSAPSSSSAGTDKKLYSSRNKKKIDKRLSNRSITTNFWPVRVKYVTEISLSMYLTLTLEYPAHVYFSIFSLYAPSNDRWSDTTCVSIINAFLQFTATTPGSLILCLFPYICVHNWFVVYFCFVYSSPFAVSYHLILQT